MLLLLVLGLAASANAQTIIQLSAKTNYPMNDMYGLISVTINNDSGGSCFINRLDEPGTTWRTDSIATFDTNRISGQYGNCGGFDVGTTKAIPSLTIRHQCANGKCDNIGFRWIRVIFSDSSFVQCDVNTPQTNQLLNSAVTLTNCQPLS